MKRSQLSRDNQRLLRNPDPKLYSNLDQIKSTLDITISRMDRFIAIDNSQEDEKYKSLFIEDLIHSILSEFPKQYCFLMCLSLLQNDFPWIYYMGKELLTMLNSNSNAGDKLTALNSFEHVLNYTYGHPMIRKIFLRKNDSSAIFKELRYLLNTLLKELELEIV